MAISKRMTVSTLTALALTVPAPSMLHAQAGALITLVVPAGQFGSDQFTDLLVNSMGAAKGFCGALDKSYRVDCLAERIDQLAEGIPDDSDYAEVRELLEQTSRDMESLVRSNRDAGKPRQRASTGSQATSRPLSPVNEAALANVNERATAILERTETLLLRTPDDDSGKKLHYTRIAEAIGSNKTLLRST
ncbi:MAG: hypothetical protein AB3N13_05565 [Arenibacterium sp.]